MKNSSAYAPDSREVMPQPRTLPVSENHRVNNQHNQH